MTFNQRRQRSPLTLRRWRLETLCHENEDEFEETIQDESAIVRGHSLAVGLHRDDLRYL